MNWISDARAWNFWGSFEGTPITFNDATLTISADQWGVLFKSSARVNGTLFSRARYVTKIELKHVSFVYDENFDLAYRELGRAIRKYYSRERQSENGVSGLD
jgi:hypothetical protein